MLYYTYDDTMTVYSMLKNMFKNNFNNTVIGCT